MDISKIRSYFICYCYLTLGWTEWQAPLLDYLFLLHFEQRSAETEGALPVDHTLTIKLVRAYKIIISFSL